MEFEIKIKFKGDKRSWKNFPVDKTIIEADSLQQAKQIVIEKYFCNPEIETVKINYKGKFDGIYVSRHILQECY